MAHQPEGIVNLQTHFSVDETIARLQALLHEKGIQVFALIDHSGEARRAGLEMRPTKLLIFGNPKAGTPLMLAAPSVAIDLPMKLLVWEDADGQVWISYNTPAYLQQRHSLPQDLMTALGAVEVFAKNAAQ
ncbi:MAG: DUF302 domain-containing protein [Acidobacteriaceae bacterium]